MKQILRITIVSIFLILTLFILTVHGENQTTVTKEDALQAINESEQIIGEMQANNFSVNYMNDSLIEAKIVFQQAAYAEILKDINLTEQEKQEARAALRLIKWQNINYGDVLVYTNDIKNRREEAFLLLDKIVVEENTISNSGGEVKTMGLLNEVLFLSPKPAISNETRDILLRAETAFSEERYNDSEKLLEEYKSAVEKDKAEASTLSGIKNGAMNFFQKYWIYIIASLIIVLVASYFIYKKFEKKILKNKIKKMKTQEKVLKDLIKKTQIERFKDNKISGLVYNIRMKKYEEKQQEIKEELPVLKNRLKKMR